MQETSSLNSGVTLRGFSHMDPVEEFKLEAGTVTAPQQRQYTHAYCPHALLACNHLQGPTAGEAATGVLKQLPQLCHRLLC